MENNPKIEHKLVETYAEDMAKVIQDDSGGLIRKIIHEQEEHDKEKKNLSPQSKKNQVFVLVGIILLLLASAIITFFLLKKDSGVVVVKNSFPHLISIDKSYFSEIGGLNRDQIIQSLSNEVNTTSVKKGGIEAIYLTENKNIVGLKRFISLIKGNLVFSTPESIYDNFLMGAVNKDSKNFFILIKTRSMIDAFDSLRLWEKKMFADLGGLFGINISSSNSYLITKSFDDGIIKNKNARVLYDKEGGVVLMYVFIDDKSVVIANSNNAIEEVIFRLTSGKIKR